MISDDGVERPQSRHPENSDGNGMGSGVRRGETRERRCTFR